MRIWGASDDSIVADIEDVKLADMMHYVTYLTHRYYKSGKMSQARFNDWFRKQTKISDDEPLRPHLNLVIIQTNTVFRGYWPDEKVCDWDDEEYLWWKKWNR